MLLSHFQNYTLETSKGMYWNIICINSTYLQPAFSPGLQAGGALVCNVV